MQTFLKRIKESHKIHLTCDIFRDIRLMLITNMPGKTGEMWRYKYYKARLRSLGENVKFEPGVFISGPEFISIGHNCWIDKYVILLAGKPFRGTRKIFSKPNDNYSGEIGEICIGDNCHIAPYVFVSGLGGVKIGSNLTLAAGAKVYSFSHHYRDLSHPDITTIFKFSSMSPQDEQALILSPVVIENDSAVGLNSIILPGSTIGKGSWVGVNSVVAHSIPSNVIAKGNPAKPFKDRFNKKDE